MICPFRAYVLFRVMLRPWESTHKLLHDVARGILQQLRRRPRSESNITEACQQAP